MIKLVHGDNKILDIETSKTREYAAVAIALSRAIFALYGNEITPKLTSVRLRMETTGEYGIGYLISGLKAIGYTLTHDQYFKNFTLHQGQEK